MFILRGGGGSRLFVKGICRSKLFAVLLRIACAAGNVTRMGEWRSV
jgi:hypothetical protein